MEPLRLDLGRESRHVGSVVDGLCVVIVFLTTRYNYRSTASYVQYHNSRYIFRTNVLTTDG